MLPVNDPGTFAANTVSVIPVKSFRLAKARLAPALAPGERARLARWTGDRVLGACRHTAATIVVCDDDEVATWARARGAEVSWQPGRGLNGALDGALDEARRAGYAHVVIAHADLVRPEGLAAVPVADTVVIVPDTVLDGTNVLSFPLAVRLTPAYGSASFSRHLAAALRTGERVTVRRDPLLALDVDAPEDLAHPLVVEVLPAWARTNPDNLPSTVPPTRR